MTGGTEAGVVFLWHKQGMRHQSTDPCLRTRACPPANDILFMLSLKIRMRILKDECKYYKSWTQIFQRKVGLHKTVLLLQLNIGIFWGGRLQCILNQKKSEYLEIQSITKNADIFREQLKRFLSHWIVNSYKAFSHFYINT